MFGSNTRTFELALGTAIGNTRVVGMLVGALRSLLRKSTGTVPRLVFVWLREASIWMPGLPPKISVKSFMPPRW